MNRPRRNKQTTSNVDKANEGCQKVKKWNEDEQRKLLYCLQLYGHKNLTKIAEEIPSKDKELIRKFLILAQSEARKRKKGSSDLENWLEMSVSETERHNVVKYKDSLLTAQVIKFLSIDGLLENHPAPVRCNGIDFAAAYKLVYQALMGYPLQPVSKATAEFIYECLDDLKIHANEKLIVYLTNCLKTKFGTKEKKLNEKSSVKSNYCTNLDDEKISVVSENSFKKPINVYQRKRPVTVTMGLSNVPPLKIKIEEKKTDQLAGSKLYSLEVGENNDRCFINVPVPHQFPDTKLKSVAYNLCQTIGFNPFELPPNLLNNSSMS